MRHVVTGDRNFYDRYYFNCHGSTDELFLIAGMGQYPNLGVQDAFVVVLHERQHRVVRASGSSAMTAWTRRSGPSASRCSNRCAVTA